MDQYAKRHYDRITAPRPRAKSVQEKLQEYVKKSRGKRRLFFMYLHKMIGSSASKSVFTMKPSQLQSMKNYLDKNFPNQITDESLMDSLLMKVFMYHSYDWWGAYDLAQDLKVNVCPYCNRQYTFTINVKTGKTRPTFDHFFDKASYPMFALSFYNLIPSCNICNSDLKNTDSFTMNTHLHPYVRGFDNDMRFSINPLNIDFINGIAKSYQIELVSASSKNSRFNTQAAGNINVFCLKELYNEHKDYVNEIIKKSRIYNRTYVKQLLKNWRGTLFNSELEIRQMIMGNYLTRDDHDKRVLSKLTADICEQLKIFNK